MKLEKIYLLTTLFQNKKKGALIFKRQPRERHGLYKLDSMHVR